MIHLSDGRKLVVPHRDFIAVGRGVVSIVDERDSTHTVDALHIVSISDPPPKRTKSAKYLFSSQQNGAEFFNCGTVSGI